MLTEFLVQTSLSLFLLAVQFFWSKKFWRKFQSLYFITYKHLYIYILWTKYQNFLDQRNWIISIKNDSEVWTRNFINKMNDIIINSRHWATWATPSTPVKSCRAWGVCNPHYIIFDTESSLKHSLNHYATEMPDNDSFNSGIRLDNNNNINLPCSTWRGFWTCPVASQCLDRVWRRGTQPAQHPTDG